MQESRSSAQYCLFYRPQIHNICLVVPEYHIQVTSGHDFFTCQMSKCGPYANLNCCVHMLGDIDLTWAVRGTFSVVD